ncbi:tetratricopeptide repeat protein, partial [Patescibacteria group bacterium]
AKISPSGHNIHNNLGDVYGKKGYYEKAIKEFETAIKIKPNYADAMHNLANLHNELGQIKQSIYWYEMAIKNNPLLWQSYINLGSIYYNLKEYALAEELFVKANELQPKNKDIKNALDLIRKIQ